MMLRRTLAIALLLAPGAALSRPAPNPIAKQAARAETTLREAADEAFMEMWRKRGAEMMQDGFTASEARKWTLWMLLGYSLGYCDDQATPTDLADWNSAFDRIYTGSLSTQDRDQMRRQGLKLYTDGIKDDTPAAERVSFCRPEMIAVRKILRTL